MRCCFTLSLILFEGKFRFNQEVPLQLRGNFNNKLVTKHEKLAWGGEEKIKTEILLVNVYLFL